MSAIEVLRFALPELGPALSRRWHFVVTAPGVVGCLAGREAQRSFGV